MSNALNFSTGTSDPNIKVMHHCPLGCWPVAGVSIFSTFLSSLAVSDEKHVRIVVDIQAFGDWLVSSLVKLLVLHPDRQFRISTSCVLFIVLNLAICWNMVVSWTITTSKHLPIKQQNHPLKNSSIKLSEWVERWSRSPFWLVLVCGWLTPHSKKKCCYFNTESVILTPK